jgi:methyl-accepting chemotaxis protein
MGSNKSPVDELVDGIDAIGSVIDENLPQLKNRIEEISISQLDNARNINEIRNSLKELHEVNDALQKTAATLDLRSEEILSAVGNLAFRLDQVQKMVLELSEKAGLGTGDNELVDTVKTLEDRLKRLEAARARNNPGKIGFD